MKEFREDKARLRQGFGEVKGNKEVIKPVRLSEIKTSSVNRISSGIGELDRVLGGHSASSGQGGFVPGEIVLLAGEPGVGKSTLLLELGSKDKENKEDQGDKMSKEIIYISGEESPEQIKARAQRLGIAGEKMLVLAETNIEGVLREMGDLRDKKDREDQKDKMILIIDSIQTLWSEDIEGSPGSISQVKGCTQRLVEFAKKTGMIVVLIGQINKEGEIAGPMMLSHMVDAVLFLEGERFTELRLLRGLKNRFGPTDEVGVFKMTEKGMEEVDNPSELFLGEVGGVRDVKGKAGAVVVCAMEGTRPMLLEIQALVTQSAIPIPRRVVLGLDYNRVMLLVAVLQKVLHLPLYNQEIIVKVSGGFKVNEPAADLGIALAIVSSYKNKPIIAKTCAFGEVGLLGEIRRVQGEEKREKEAKKLGFTNILSSQSIGSLLEATESVLSIKN